MVEPPNVYVASGDLTGSALFRPLLGDVDNDLLFLCSRAQSTSQINLEDDHRL